MQHSRPYFFPSRRAIVCGVTALFMACTAAPKTEWEPSDEQITSIARLKELYEGYPRKIDRETYIRGGIISSDREGNVRQSIIIEDSTGGIEVKVAAGELFKSYPRGKSIVVRCNGLTIGSYGGSLQLGDTPASGYETGLIRAEKLPAFVQVSALPEQEIKPHTLVIPQVSGRWVNCWVRFDNVQFAGEELPLTWGDPAADTDRHITDRQGHTLVIRINSESDLAKIPLPQGSGSIEGILTYFHKTYQLRPLNTAGVSMKQPRF